MRIAAHIAEDIRFPTSQELHGSDAMNPDPDYSCAYVELKTDSDLSGHGLAFTIGRGTELCVAAIDSLAPLILNHDLDAFEDDLGLAPRLIAADSQLRWLGPEKGVTQLAAAALINAIWDLLAKRAGKPLWRYVCDLPSGKIIEAVDFRHISDFITPGEALERLQTRESTRQGRIGELEKSGYPAYTTSAGWIGYSDQDIKRRLRAAYEDGWRRFKIKVGRDLDEDKRRCALFRETLGEDVSLAVDANQVWDVDEAIAWANALRPFKILWVEEPTSPDDILGHKAIAEAIAPIAVATGEHAHNRIMFKQFLQAKAIKVCQIDACRLAGVNEVLAVLLMADKAGVPVCPHAGGVGLCEHVQHLSMIDFVAVSGSMDGRAIEYAAHLHEHFVSPVEIRHGRYMPPESSGYSTEMKSESRARFTFPTGSAWSNMPGRHHV